MLEQFVGAFFSKVGEKLADGTLSRLDFQKTWESLERRLKRLSVKANDVMNEVKNAELSGKKKRKGAVELWLNEVQKLESEIEELLPQLETQGFIIKFVGGDQSMKLLGRVDELLEESRDFGDLVLDVCGIPAVPFLSGRLVGEKFEESFRKIWKLLVVDGVSSIGIQGMGGGGKITLAKNIHNRLLKEPNHVCVLWITVSQTFTIKNLQDEIASRVGLNLVDEHNEDIRAARLKKVLSQRKNFVLILDDVWKKINLKKLGDPLSVQGGKLIITTRSSEVCDQIGCKEMVRVTTLSEGEAWDLFKMTSGEEITLTPQIQEIAIYMAAKCRGLPLAIITTAGSMKGKNDVHEWRNALEELNELILSGSGDEEEKVFEILKYSFDRLDRGEEKHGGYTKLQHCFLYCCLYPEDLEINRIELIEQFISEEMLDTKRSRRKQVDQGRVMLNKLVNVCLLESNKTRGWVKMHDVVRAMALKITKGRYMRIDRQQHDSKECLNKEFWTEELEKVSLMECSYLAGSESCLLNIPAEWTPNCPKLSTLLLQRNKHFGVIPPNSFLWMHNLHVLNLSHTEIKVLPDSLSNLRVLRSLLLSGCQYLRCVPYLGNLKELRELNLSASSIQQVPVGMEELTNLECLKIDVRHLKLLPGNLLPNFQKLECLHLPFHIEAPVEEIESLKQLEEFRGRVKDVFDFRILMGHHPRFKEHNQSYQVLVAEFRLSSAFLVHYKQVRMCGTHLSEERWADAMSLAPGIRCLELYQCTSSSDCLLDDLRQLNVNVMRLEILGIVNCEGTECIWKREQFPTDEAKFKHPFNLKQGVMMELKRFSCLKHLQMRGCKDMKRMGLPVWELQNLEQISVALCPEIEEIIEVGNQAVPIVHLPKLKWLSLQHLPKLKTICKATMVCTSIVTINIKGCLGVKKLPIVFGDPDYDSPPSAVEDIFIRESEKEWWESLELEHPSLHHLLRPFIRNEK